MSKDISHIVEILSEHITQGDFSINDSALAEIEASLEDELVSGWVFAYKVYAAEEQKRSEMLKNNISNTNPRIREQVCDIIGDECIVHLRYMLVGLYSDSVDYVASAAKYNYDEMF